MLIPLNSRKYPGLYALIDEIDYELVSMDSWWPDSSHGTNFYARSSKGGRSMHRLIMGVAPDQRVDHINQNGLDNRRCNLRIATTAQNNANVRPSRIGKSGYLGVYRVASGRWASQYRRDNKTVCLGTFDTPEEAASAYDSAIVESRGEFAVTNKSLGLLGGWYP